MRYSEEERQNSKINRADLAAYISSHYVEAGGAMGAAPVQAAAINVNMAAPAASQAPTPVSSFMCGMAAPAKPPVMLNEAPCEPPAFAEAKFTDAVFEEPLSAPRKKKEHGLLKAVLKKPEGAAAKRSKSAPREEETDTGNADSAEDQFIENEDYADDEYDDEFTEELYRKLSLRVSHVEDSFSDYLMFLIGSKGMSNAEVYKRALVDKKVFSKIKNNPDYHPQKLTAMCLCIGAKLNLDESRDLLARAGYALSPCDKTDIIFQYFIEKGIYDMIELDIQLEEYGQPCIIA